MRYLRLMGRVSAILALAAALGATALGQATLPAESIGGPLSGPPVLGAPFSADATTTVHAILGDVLDSTRAPRIRDHRDICRSRPCGEADERSACAGDDL